MRQVKPRAYAMKKKFCATPIVLVWGYCKRYRQGLRQIPLLQKGENKAKKRQGNLVGILEIVHKKKRLLGF